MVCLGDTSSPIILMSTVFRFSRHDFGLRLPERLALAIGTSIRLFGRVKEMATFAFIFSLFPWIFTQFHFFLPFLGLFLRPDLKAFFVVAENLLDELD